ncbi:translocation/assembly module TamB domain-containing protein [Marivirga atlantica]|uniref:Translocation/assembly module TamB n=1 Tax=Marivirga atlantica TaxID=1548457 RepID=A0A937ANJ5_9BACT|nr:translocation/assembly module TamB domain-containing protein [Marivirga atlantica]MBL0765957.1 translocation/assembly module TamB [Marivirga atlantica]
MKEEQNISQGIKKGIAKAILYIFLIVFFALSFVALAMQSSYVQTKVAQYGSEYLSEKLGFSITIERVNIEWFDKLAISDLKVKDREGESFIDAKRLVVDYDIRELITPENIVLDEVSLTESRVMLRRNKGEDLFNIDNFIYAIKEFAGAGDSTKAPKTFIMNEVTLKDITLGIINLDNDSITEGFNYNQFILKNLNASVNGFKTRRDTIMMKVESLTAVDSASSLTIKSLSTDFEISQSKLSLAQLDLDVNDSHIADSIVFNYNSMSNLSYLVDSVKIAANFKNTSIHAKDLAYFAPYVKRYKDTYKLNGSFSGKVKNFYAKDIDLVFGDNSHLKGRLRMDGLPDFNESFIDFTLQEANFTPKDISQYVVDSLTNRKIDILGPVDFKGRFTGFPKDFVANGVFTSQLGRIESDLNLKIAQNIEESEYSGNLSTFNFNIGRLLEVDSLLQKVQMTGNVKGKGLSLATANLKLNANLGFIGINGYEYQNIKTNAQLAKEFFNGEITINDPILKMDMDGSIDFRDKKNIVNVNVAIDTVNLRAVNLSKSDIYVKAEGTLKSEGNSWETIKGQAYLKDVYAKYGNNSLQLDTLGVITDVKDQYRELYINSDLISGSLNGEYEFLQLQKDIAVMVKEFRLNIKNDANQLNEYYSQLDTLANYPDYQVLFDFNIKAINPLIQLFVPELYIQPNTKISGSFNNGINSIFNLSGTIDSINYDGSSFKNNEIDVNLSKDHRSRNVLGMAYVYSQSQKLFEELETENIESELIWTGQEIDFNAFIQQPKFDNDLDVAGLLTFKEDSTEIRIDQSRIKALDKNWSFIENNLFTITDGEYYFKNFGLLAESEKIVLDGVLSNDSSKYLTTKVENFNLSGINTISTTREFEGSIDGIVNINKLNDKYLILSDVTIDDLYVDAFLVGDIKGKSNWKAESKQLGLDFIVNRNGTDIISVNGNYTPNKAKNTLDLEATLDNANLVIAEPFINTIFSDIKGLVNGNFKITGDLNYPIVSGLGKVRAGQVRVNYLNTLYDFNGNVSFDLNKITLQNIELKDQQENLAYLSGDLLHDGFTDLFLDLKGNMYSFNVLNTTANDNSLYYGNAFVSGDISFYGPANNLVVDAKARSEKGTKLFIPVESTSSVQQEEYIHFINIKDTANHTSTPINTVDEVDITGLTLNFDLEVTPDAYAEIIFDIKSGDIIRGRGNGEISLNIDTNGAFTMLGDYTLTEGGYNFTLYNIINKEFSIQPGSRISWDGDPYGGNLDITAVYEQNVSLLPVVDTTYSDSPELRRRYPAKVILDLDGDLLQPQVDFDIDISGYPESITSSVGAYSLGPVMASFEAELEADEQEMKRQVFSLIILRRLSPPSSFAVSGSIGNSVSEFLSNQLSYWVTQIDENLEIDVDLGSFSDEEFNTFQLRLSYSFLGGRLRVTRDGGFSQGNTTDVNQEILGILGDWSVEYLLTEDGKLRVKVYNKTNYSAIDKATNSATTSTGVSLVHVTSFNQIREVFNKNKDKPSPPENKQEPEEEEEEEEEDKKEKDNTPPSDPQAILREDEESTSNDELK